MNIKAADFYIEHLMAHVESIQNIDVKDLTSQELVAKEMGSLKAKLEVLFEIARVQGILIGINITMKDFLVGKGTDDAVENKKAYDGEINSLFKELLKTLEPCH